MIHKNNNDDNNNNNKKNRSESIRKNTGNKPIS
jgi:hypothetical protein